jgi:hypothetical protein
MSRSGYSDDYDNWQQICYRGAVKQAINGRRGQGFLKEMLLALDALPEKRLIVGELEERGCVCAIGAVGQARGIDMGRIEPEDSEQVARIFGIADSLAREIVFENDEGSWRTETPEERFARMRQWVVSKIKVDAECPIQGGA